MYNTEKRKFSSSIFSSPERGEGGKSSYRGNCCPGIIENFINQYEMRYMSDYAIGGGTTVDVCQSLGVKGVWTDLRLGFDLMNHEIPDCPENIFYHPPYFNMNGKIIYSKTEYNWRAVQEKYGYDPRNSDLSQMKSWDEFMKALNYTVLKQFAAMETGGHMGILMGDIKTKGKLYSMLFEIAKPGTVENVVIKTQHNCVSDRTSYSGKFIPIDHEYLLILRKDGPYIMDFQIARNVKMDIRDSKSVTWKDIVSAAMQSLKGKASLEQIYAEIDGHERCRQNPHWKDKVRQVLQMYPQFKNCERGVWKIAA